MYRNVVMSFHSRLNYFFCKIWTWVFLWLPDFIALTSNYFSSEVTKYLGQPCYRGDPANILTSSAIVTTNVLYLLSMTMTFALF